MLVKKAIGFSKLRYWMYGLSVAMIAVAMFVIGIAIHFLRAGIAGVYSVDAAVIDAALPALLVHPNVLCYTFRLKVGYMVC